jgi:hypothetical protein
MNSTTRRLATMAVMSSAAALLAASPAAAAEGHPMGPYSTYTSCNWKRTGFEASGYRTTACTAPVYPNQWFFVVYGYH